MDEARKAAVQRGLSFLYTNLSRDNYSPLLRLGGQCVSIFYDVFLSETDAALCEQAREWALALLTVLAKHWLMWPQPLSVTQLFEILGAVRYEPLGFDSAELLAHADEAIAHVDMVGLTMPGRFLADWRSGQLCTCDWYEVAYRVFIIEYCEVVHPGRLQPRPRVGMREVLASLRRHSLEPPCQVAADSDFGEGYYLATHLCYWLSAYSATLELRDAPWLVAYVRDTLAFWLAQAELRTQGIAGEATDGLVYVDLDGLAECVDVLRGLQHSRSASSTNKFGTTSDAQERQHAAFMQELPALLDRGTQWLLSRQTPNGSWAPSWAPSVHPKDPLKPKLRHVAAAESEDNDTYTDLYDALHPTWTCTMALCDRPPASKTSERQRPGLLYTERMRALMQETCFSAQTVPKKARQRLHQRSKR